MSQSRLDAMADAETLRRVLGRPEWSEMDKRTTERGCIAVAQFYGLESALWTQQRHPIANDDARFYAEAAARAAFRAVPELREKGE